MPPPNKMIDVEIEAFMTGAKSALPGYDDAQIIPGMGIIFRMHENETATAESIDTYVLPWHSFDGCHIRRITRAQYEVRLKDTAAQIMRHPCAHIPEDPTKVPACFGAFDPVACEDCVISAGCRTEKEIRIT